MLGIGRDKGVSRLETASFISPGQFIGDFHVLIDRGQTFDEKDERAEILGSKIPAYLQENSARDPKRILIGEFGEKVQEPLRGSISSFNSEDELVTVQDDEQISLPKFLPLFCEASR